MIKKKEIFISTKTKKSYNETGIEFSKLYIIKTTTIKMEKFLI